jgi:hypothetical protein
MGAFASNGSLKLQAQSHCPSCSARQHSLSTSWPQDASPTGPGHRFIMPLYLPLMWILAQGAEQIRIAVGTRPANSLFLACHLAICALLVSRIFVLLLDTRFEKVSYAF